MVAYVTLHVNDCSNNAALSGATVTDGYSAVYTNAYGEILVYWDDTIYSGYVVQISKSGFQTRSVPLYNSQNGTTVTTCLNHATGGGTTPPSTSCFTGDTLVTMADGETKSIAQVRVGDWVLGRHGQQNRVVEIERPVLGDRSLYSINGSLPFVTAEHPIMTAMGWKSIDPRATAVENPLLVVGRLAINDILIKLEKCLITATTANATKDCVEPVFQATSLTRLQVNRADPQTPLYNLLLDGDHTYFANGYLVHNKCFIVSAATGSQQSEDVVALRALRDQVAARAPAAGRLIAAIYEEYWQFSPAVAARIDEDGMLKQGALLAAVRPLLAWYELAGALALDGDVATARAQFNKSCPAWMRPASIAALVGQIRRERSVPADAPATIQVIATDLARAASLPLVDWAILSPLETCWTVASRGGDPVATIADWLALAPLAPMNDASSHEIDQVTALLGFDRVAQQRLSERFKSTQTGCN
ncbi:MAG: Hint domain-containing protein [Gallionellaceae bacterium]|jgi:hypothetical protein